MVSHNNVGINNSVFLLDHILHGVIYWALEAQQYMGEEDFMVL